MDTRLKEVGAIGKILTAAALWSTIGLASVYSGNYVVLAFFRSLVASTIALFFVKSREKSAIVSGVLLGVLFSVYPLAAALVGLGPAAYLLYTAPLWTTLVSSLLGERARRRDLVAVSLILIAVALMVLGASLGALNPFGFAAGLASGISYGSYIAVARFYSKENRDVEVSLGAMPYTLAVTAPAVAIYIAIYGPGDLAKTAAFGAYLGLFCTLIPYRLFSSGVKAIGAARASVLATLEPVLATIWGYLFLGQTPSLIIALSYVLITAAAVIASTG